MIENRILFEDNHLIALNKHCGEIVQPDRTGDLSLIDGIKSFIKERDAKPGNVFLGLCHRLDRPTSGVVIFAKTGKALSRMNELFRNGEVEKIYWAIVNQAPSKAEDHLRDYLAKNAKQNKSYTVESTAAGAKPAELRYKLLSTSDRYWLLEIELLTGRHHQIRAQLASIGCTVRGDLKYGAPRSNPGGGIDLHARTVAFTHPVKKTLISITAPVPDGRIWGAFA